MASSSVSFPPPDGSGPQGFRLLDPKLNRYFDTKQIRRVCYRCDTRSPAEIFNCGFVNRNLEESLGFAIKKTLSKVNSFLPWKKDVHPVMSPIEGQSPKKFYKPLLHPFAPRSKAAGVYEAYFKNFTQGQTALYRNEESWGEHGKLPPMFDIAPSTGVAVTLFPEFAPLFPVGRGKDFATDAWLYAVWVDEAIETYELQLRDKQDIAAVREVVVQYVPFYHVLGAVHCARMDICDPPALTPLGFFMKSDLQWNPHVGRNYYDRVRADLLPLLTGRLFTVLSDPPGGWRVIPPTVGLASSPPLPGITPVASGAAAASASASAVVIPPSHMGTPVMSGGSGAQPPMGMMAPPTDAPPMPLGHHAAPQVGQLGAPPTGPAPMPPVLPKP